jgi:hypothetical protein
MKNLRSLLWLAMVLFIVSGVFSQAVKTPQALKPKDTPATLLQKDSAAGLELWQTMLGKLWIPAPGIYVIKHLQWEQKVTGLPFPPDACTNG